MIDILLYPIVSFIIGIIIGIIFATCLYKGKKVGKILMIEDPDDPNKPYLFMELDDSTKIERIRRTNSVLLEIDKKSSH